MAARGRTAAAAAATASRCRSRCELRQAAGSCHRASLVRRAQAAGSTALLLAGRGGSHAHRAVLPLTPPLSPQEGCL